MIEAAIGCDGDSLSIINLEAGPSLPFRVAVGLKP
jgi:hypothetical protein